MSIATGHSPRDPGEILGDLGGSWIWWLISGAFSLVAGIILLAWPHGTLRVVAIVIGLQFLLIGAVRFVRAFARADGGAGGEDSSRLFQALLALLAVLAGVLVLRHQMQTVGLIALVVGLYWLIAGIVSIYVAIDRPGLPHRGWIFGLGALGVAAGVVVLSAPIQSVVVLARLLGVWLILIGVLDLVLALAVRLTVRQVHQD